jgi:hypothetical protein
MPGPICFHLTDRHRLATAKDRYDHQESGAAASQPAQINGERPRSVQSILSGKDYIEHGWVFVEVLCGGHCLPP